MSVPARRRLLVATSNPHKLAELRLLLPEFDVESFVAPAQPPEDGRTYLENARTKARHARAHAPADAWAAGDRKKALELIPDEVVDELVVHGPAQACRERVAEYHATGLNTPVIMVVPAPGVDEAAAVRQLAPPG